MAVQTIYLTSSSQWTNPVDYIGVNVKVMPNVGAVVMNGHVHKDTNGNGGDLTVCTEGNSPITLNVNTDGSVRIVSCSQGGQGEQ